MALLRQRGRLTYRTLQLQFQLDDTHLEALRDELMKGQRLAADEEGAVLVWIGDAASPPAPAVAPAPALTPRTSTPPSLTVNILTSRRALEGERKQVTMLFADVQGSMALLAERVDGGYRCTGRTSFGSLRPVWTSLGLHGMDTSDPHAPPIVHACMLRDTKGSTIKETWDVLGMRATRSEDTLREGALVPDQYNARGVPTGAAGIDLCVLALCAWAQPAFATLSDVMAQRAFDGMVAHVKPQTSLALSRSTASHEEVQHAIADMALALEAIGPHLDTIAPEWSDGVDHGHLWGARLVAAQHRVVEGAWQVGGTALDLAGGFGIFTPSGIERRFRDARLGCLHPATAFVTRECGATTVRGISMDEPPRWGCGPDHPLGCHGSPGGGGRPAPRRGQLRSRWRAAPPHGWPPRGVRLPGRPSSSGRRSGRSTAMGRHQQYRQCCGSHSDGGSRPPCSVPAPTVWSLGSH
jgi:hypothetical protein